MRPRLTHTVFSPWRGHNRSITEQAHNGVGQVLTHHWCMPWPGKQPLCKRVAITLALFSITSHNSLLQKSNLVAFTTLCGSELCVYMHIIPYSTLHCHPSNVEKPSDVQAAANRSLISIGTPQCYLVGGMRRWQSQGWAGALLVTPTDSASVCAQQSPLLYDMIAPKIVPEKVSTECLLKT